MVYFPVLMEKILTSCTAVISGILKSWKILDNLSQKWKVRKKRNLPWEKVVLGQLQNSINSKNIHFKEVVLTAPKKRNNGYGQPLHFKLTFYLYV